MTAKRRPAAVPDRHGRAVAYIRVSAVMGRSGDDFHSPELQRSQIDRAAETAGMKTLQEAIIDLDQTGRDFNRKGIDQVRKLAEAGQIDAIAIYDVSRLGRNVLESLQFIKWLEKRGVGVISACEQVDTSTPAGKMMLTTMLNVAQYRSDETGRNWSQLIEKRAKSGRHHGNRLTGFVSVEGKLVADPAVAPAMREAFTMFAQGVGSKKIMQLIAAARGKRVYIQQVKRWIVNPAYRGYAIHHGVEMAGAHEALVDDETWRLCQERIAREAGMAPRDRSPQWSLVGLAYCSHGCRLYRHPYRDEKTRERVFRLECSKMTNRCAGDECPGIGTPLFEPIEAEVLRRVHEYIQLLKGDVGARAAALNRRATVRVDVEALRRQVTDARTAIAKLTTAWARNQVGDREYNASLAELNESEQIAQQQIDELGGTDVLDEDPFQRAAAAEALLQLWPDMIGEERNRVMKKILKRVVIRRRERWMEPEADRVQIGEDDWLF